MIVNFLERLPYLCIIEIFKYLNQEELLNTSYVCKRLFKLINPETSISRIKSFQLCDHEEIEIITISHHLKRLDLSGSSVDDEMLKKLSNKKKLNLHAINLGFCWNLTNESLQYYFSKQFDLSFIGLAECQVEKQVYNS